jgi:hypothetical protein
MNKIVADRYFRQTQEFIQQYVEDKFLPDDTRNQMIICYESLTRENAQSTYECVIRLYDEDYQIDYLNQEINKWLLFGCLFLVAILVIYLFFYLTGTRHIFFDY